MAKAKPGKTPAKAKPPNGVIFRRFITVNGKKLDAHAYGLKAWPIKLK